MSADVRSDERFVETLRALLERSRDPQVHDRVWDYREGTITRGMLYRDPAVARAMREWYAESLAAQAALGHTPERVRARLAELRAEGRTGLV